MEGFAAAVVAIAIIAGAVLLVAFIFYCLVRISNADEVRFLPKWAWAVIVVCVNPLGGLAFLLAQHLRIPRRAELLYPPGPSGSATRTASWPPSG